MLLTTAYDVVAHVSNLNSGIQSVQFVVYKEEPGWRGLLRASEAKNLDAALQGMKQRSNQRIVNEVWLKDVSAEALDKCASELPSGQLLAASSKVELPQGKWAHIPMMDFICAVTGEHLSILKQLIKETGQGSGFILESGRSYHYYGLELLSEEKWKLFLGKCLLMTGFVDERFVGHQLIDGRCILRLSSGKLNPHLPRVVASL